MMSDVLDVHKHVEKLVAMECCSKRGRGEEEVAAEASVGARKKKWWRRKGKCLANSK
jgi:hypothetical protein